MYHCLSDELRSIRSTGCFGCRCDFAYWEVLVLLLFNPVVVVHYAGILTMVCSFCYAAALILYQLVCYFMFLHLILELAALAYDNLKQYNRGSLFRHSLYRARCYLRDLWEGHCAIPHVLHSYLMVCLRWASYVAIQQNSLQWDSMAIFAARKYLSGRHYGVFCRPMSMWVVVLTGCSRSRAHP